MNALRYRLLEVEASKNRRGYKKDEKMMAGSIAIKNDHEGEKTVLLLPGLKHCGWESDAGVKSCLGWSGRTWQGKHTTELDGLARLATAALVTCGESEYILDHVRAGKRIRQDGDEDDNEGHVTGSEGYSSPLPYNTSGSSTSTTPAESPSLDKAELRIAAVSQLEVSGTKVISSSKWKRQRTGPSCDVCRSKKIKCDATIIVLWQDGWLLSMAGREAEDQSLHYPLNIENCPERILEKIPKEIVQQLRERKDMSLVRHLDKLIVFTPCSSCWKKKACACNFSKGFTRADVAVYSNLNKKLGKRGALGDFTVKDYLSAGYTFD